MQNLILLNKRIGGNTYALDGVNILIYGPYGKVKELHPMVSGCVNTGQCATGERTWPPDTTQCVFSMSANSEVTGQA